MTSVNENFPNNVMDLRSLAMDSHCLRLYLSIGIIIICVRLYEWDYKLIHEEHSTWSSLEDKLFTYFIHWVLISHCYVKSCKNVQQEDPQKCFGTDRMVFNTMVTSSINNIPSLFQNFNNFLSMIISKLQNYKNKSIYFFRFILIISVKCLMK